MLHLFRNAIVVGTLLALGGVARADSVTYNFTGTITSSTASSISTGNTFSGQFTFDPAAVGTGSPTFMTYDGQTFSVNISGSPGYSVTATTPPGIQVQNDGTDFFAVAGTPSVIPFPPPAPPEWNPGINDSSMALFLSDSTGTAFSSANLPSSLDLSAFDSATFSLTVSWYFTPPEGVTQQYTDDIEGNITSLTLAPPSAVPEPASATLAGLGLASLLGYGWRRRRSDR